MAENINKVRGTTSNYKNDKGGAVTRNYPLLGIVKNNIDPTRSGRLQVYIADFGTPDPNDSKSWTTVNYMSPFYGVTDPDGTKSGEGNYTSNPHSYGWWANPPDIGTTVVCIFVNGDTNFGYYIGCVPQAGLNHMVPAVGSADNVTLNSGEAQSYGGATRLPSTEINQTNKNISGSSNFNNKARPVHSYQAAILNKQGLIRDPDRGTIGSTSVRESPSRVFGFSTPGRPIYNGGFTDETIAPSALSAQDSALKVIGRRGGHSLVLDDGDISGRDQLIRMRSSSGHQILMSDSAQTIFIIHANGQSWVELGKEGTIDMYATNSVNVRTQGDLNLHADNNMNLHAAKKLNIFADQIAINSDKETSIRTGTDLNQFATGNFNNKAGGTVAINSGGAASMAAGGIAYINGSKVNLNTGAGPQAIDITAITKLKHTDTLYDSQKGYAAAPGKLDSIVSRAPAHSPWANANQGVDVKVSLNANDNLPAAPSTNVAAAVAAAPSAPSNPVTTDVASTVPPTEAVGGSIDKSVTSAVVAQNALDAATGPAKDAVAAGAGIVTDAAGATTAALGSLAQTPSQLAAAGILKPGADVAVNAALAQGKTLEQAIPTNLFTGKDGINSVASFVNNTAAQVGAQVTLMQKGLTDLVSSGTVTGNESAASLAGLVNTAANAGTAAAKALVAGAGTVAGLTGAVSSLSSGVSSVTNIANSVSSAATGAVNAVNGIMGSAAASVNNLMAAGTFAANLGEKALGGLSSLSGSLSSLGGGGLSGMLGDAKGLVGAAFDSVVNSFPKLPANVPINLAVAAGGSTAVVEAYKPAFIQDPNTGEMVRNYSDAEVASMQASNASINSSLSGLVSGATSAVGNIGSGISNALSSAGAGINNVVSSVTGGAGSSSNGSTDILTSASTAAKGLINTVSTGLSALPGGLNATASIVNNATGALNSIPGTQNLTAAVTGAVGAVSSGLNAVNSISNGAQSALKAGGDLLSSVSKTLSGGDLAGLNSAIGALTSGGPNGIKLPTIGINTTNIQAVVAQTKQLLGDSKVPMPEFGTKGGPINPELASATQSYQQASDAYQQARDDNFEFRKLYRDAEVMFGPDSDETKAAYDAWKQNEQKMDSLQKQLAGTSTNLLSRLT